MSAMDELRRLLDERGVEYKRHYLNTSWYAGTKPHVAADNMDGTLTVDKLTPEQAIAATLGADELNSLAERTCKEFGSVRVWQSCNVWLHELSCGHEVDTLENEPPNYCPNCGAKVVSE